MVGLWRRRLLLLLFVHITVAYVPDSLVSKELCASRGYYTNGGDCSAVQAAVAANHSTPLPILTLGDPRKPPMFFIHGWPDSAALWVNHFESFCLGPSAEFFCAAVRRHMVCSPYLLRERRGKLETNPSALLLRCMQLTWTNHHPDLPEVTDPAELWPDRVLDKIEATAQSLGLVNNITLVIHDWGSMFGYQLAAKRPEWIARIVSFDIGNLGNPAPGFKAFCYGTCMMGRSDKRMQRHASHRLPQVDTRDVLAGYQHANIAVYEGKSDAVARTEAAAFAPEPQFVTCAIIL
jgi:pimeloyl-ACP methyl ester carboxylesterase